MKKIIFALSLVLLSAIAEAQASFTPNIFTPVPVGTVKRTVAYLKEAPTLTAFNVSMTAYVYMIGQDNKLVEVPINVKMVNPPSNWRKTFIMDDDTGTPVSYPKVINIAVNMKAIKMADGSVIGDPDITY